MSSGSFSHRFHGAGKMQENQNCWEIQDGYVFVYYPWTANNNNNCTAVTKLSQFSQQVAGWSEVLPTAPATSQNIPKTGEKSKYLSSELGEQVLFCGLRGKSWILLKFLHSKRQPEKVIGSGLSIWLLRTFLWYRFTLISSTCFGQQGLYFQSLRKSNFIQK